MKAAAALLATLLPVACAHAPATATATPADPLARAAAWLAGDFDNRAQAASDPRYLALSVRWRPIWTARGDGRWFYVELALAASPERPYRRRVHRLRDDGAGGVVSEVWRLRDEDALAGDDAAAALAALQPADLQALPGCEVFLATAPDGFRGTTRGRDCPSRLRGATWTSADVRLDGDGFASWDRGWTADGAQAWGAVDGPYEFRRR